MIKVKVSYDSGADTEHDCGWLPYGHELTKLATARAKAKEFIGSIEPIEVRPGVYYPRSRVILYKLVELNDET